jgi:hypothetical protein
VCLSFVTHRLESPLSQAKRPQSLLLPGDVGSQDAMDLQSRPGEPEHESSLFTSHGREEVLTAIKMHSCAKRVRSQE